MCAKWCNQLLFFAHQQNCGKWRLRPRAGKKKSGIWLCERNLASKWPCCLRDGLFKQTATHTTPCGMVPHSPRLEHGACTQDKHKGDPRVRVTGRVIPSCIGFQGIGFQNLSIYFYTLAIFYKEVRSWIKNPTGPPKSFVRSPWWKTYTQTWKHAQTETGRQKKIASWDCCESEQTNAFAQSQPLLFCLRFGSLHVFALFLSVSLSHPSVSRPPSPSIRLALIRQPQAHLSARPYCMWQLLDIINGSSRKSRLLVF